MLCLPPTDPFAPHAKGRGLHVFLHDLYDLWLTQAGFGLNGIKRRFIAPSQLNNMANLGIAHYCIFWHTFLIRHWIAFIDRVNITQDIIA